ncbi:F-box/LRR protein [Medicago truncatula]|uniref:F-box/LRR protein n=1 Tax=Medicago truncatula TaxID=3880 RepID=A0A072V5R1_MEDTR|nr:F-box/LRR protein [Medicago truncatula]
MELLPPPPSSSATSSSNSMPILDSRERNWLDLPRDAVLSIFQKLPTIDILIRTPRVCTTWRKISKDPFLYRTIDMFDLGYISASHLRRLHLACCYRVTDEVLCEVAEKFSHLEELDICISGLAICPLKAIGRCCPRLKTLEFRIIERGNPSDDDEEAFDIELNMHGFRRLQLFRDEITNKGLLAILDGCPHLEYLYMRQGFW